MLDRYSYRFQKVVVHHLCHMFVLLQPYFQDVQSVLQHLSEVVEVLLFRDQEGLFSSARRRRAGAT